MTVKSNLDRLAEALLAKALSAEAAATTDAQIDIFKAVSTYHLGTQRVAKSNKQPDTDAPATFKDILSRVAGTQKGVTA